MEWWQLVLVFALLVLGTGYGAFHAMGAEKFNGRMKRVFCRWTPDWLSQRLGWSGTPDEPEGKHDKQEKPAAPAKISPPPPAASTAADSSQAAKESLRRFFKRMR